MYNILEDVPSIPKMASFTILNLGITTRVMAEKMKKRRESINENIIVDSSTETQDRNRRLSFKPSETDNRRRSSIPVETEDRRRSSIPVETQDRRRSSIPVETQDRKRSSVPTETQNRRRSSKFLEGTLIPNSIIKLEEVEDIPDLKDEDTIKKERDEFVENVLEQFKRKERESLMNEEKIDREALMKIKEELQRRSLVSSIEDSMTKKSLNATIESLKTTKNEDVTQWEKLKDKRRISHRTSILAPLNGERRPTIESIKQSIENSKVIQKLLLDDIEERKNKLIQTEVSIFWPDEYHDSAGASSNMNAKGLKKNSKVYKRKSLLKNDRSISGSISSRISKSGGKKKSKKRN